MNAALLLNEKDFQTALREVAQTVIDEMRDAMLEAKQPPPPIMTREQLAEFWQVSEQHINNCMRDTANPIPHHYLKTSLRFDLREVSEWSRENARRQKVDKSPVIG